MYKKECKCKKTKQIIDDILELEKLEEKKKHERKSYERGNNFNNHPTHRYGHNRFEYEPKWRGESDWRRYINSKTSTNKAKVTVTNKQVKDIRFSDLEINSLITAVDAISLLIKKHNDYGPKNISDAPGGPLNGLAVRLHDKVARLAHLVSNNQEPQNESLKDTFIDLVNYGIIGLLVLEDKWDK